MAQNLEKVNEVFEEAKDTYNTARNRVAFIHHSDWFYGNEVSEEGKRSGWVDYRTLAKAFDAVMSNDLISLTNGVIGYWEQESGYVDHTEAIEDLERAVSALEYEAAEYEAGSEEGEDIQEKISEVNDWIEELENDQDDQPEVFQYFIVDDNGAKILEEAEEIVYYNSELDMYLWGVTHWGTSWDYVMTNIKIEIQED